jgi:hypothetical protein
MNRRRSAALALAAGGLLLTAGAAAAEPGSAGRDGMTLTVSKASDLAVDGEKVRVRGSGYDRNKGIYVAFCVDNGPGRVPTPCGGGADTEGTSGNSVWISDFPPAYGTGLARPYGDGGTFDVEINVKAILRPDNPNTEANETVDCRTTRCGVVTRNDHTRSEDRSQDLIVPISFAKAAAAAKPAQSSPSGPTPASNTGSSPGTTGKPAAAGGRSQVTAPAPTPDAAAAAAAPVAPVAAASAAASGEEPQPAAGTDEGAQPLPADGTEADADALAVDAADGQPLAPLLLTGAVLLAGAGAVLRWRRRRGPGALSGA